MGNDNTSFLTCARGTTYTVSAPDRSKRYIQIEGMDLDNVLLQGINGGEQDIMSAEPTLNSEVVYYLFGKAATPLDISGVCLLGPVDNMNGSMKSLIDFVNEKRVSKSKSAITVTIGGTKGGYGLKVFLYKLAFGQIDSVFNTQAFVLQTVIANLPKK